MLKEKSVRKKRTSRKGRTSRKRRTSRKGRISSKRRTSRKRITSRKRTSRKRRTSRRKSKKYRSKGETNRRIKGRRTRKPPSLNQELLGGTAATREDAEKMPWEQEPERHAKITEDVKNQKPPLEIGEMVNASFFKKIDDLKKKVDSDKHMLHSDAEKAGKKLKEKEDEAEKKRENLELEYNNKRAAGESGHALVNFIPNGMSKVQGAVRDLENKTFEAQKKAPYMASWEGGEDKEVTLEELKTRNGNNYADLTSDEVNELYNLGQKGFEVYAESAPTNCIIVGGYNTNTNDNPVWNYMVDCESGRSGNIKKGVKNVYISEKDGDQEKKWLERQEKGGASNKGNNLSKLEEGTLILVEGKRLGKYIKSESGFGFKKKHYIHFLGSGGVETINKPSNWSAEIDKIQNYVTENGSKLGEIENYKYVELE